MAKTFIVPAGFFIMLCLGSVYSWSIFRKPLQNELLIGAFESGLPFMVLLIVYSITMLFTGKYIGKIKHKKLIFIGALFIGLGWALSGFVKNIWMITFFYGFFVGAGIGIVYGIPMAAVMEWYGKNRGLAVGLVLSGFGLSAIITAPVLEKAIELYGLSNTFKLTGVFFLVIVSILGIFIKNRKIEDNIADNASLIENLKNLISQDNFRILWIVYALGALSGLTAIGISGPLAQELAGLTPAGAAAAVSLFAAFNGLGRPLFGMLTDKAGFKNTAILNFVIIITASVTGMLINGSLKVLFYISFCMLWFSLGGWLALAPVATAKIFGSENYRKVYGFVFTAYGAAAFTGILISGLIRDISGTYSNVFLMTLLASVTGIFILYKSQIKV